jgi:hypothetical protein
MLVRTEEGIDLLCAHFCRMAGETLFRVVEENKALSPMDIRFFYGRRIVFDANGAEKFLKFS